MQRYVIVCSLLAAHGCASDDALESPSGNESDASAVPGSGDAECTEALELCDIRVEECQQRLGEVVACLRESDAELAPIRLISVEDYADLLQAGADTQTAEQALAIMRWFRGLADFGLTTAEADPMQRAEASAARVAAAYLWDTGEIAVIDRGMPGDDMESVITLAHEIVHAQQDAEHGLKAWTERWSVNDDRALAAAAVVEGEAVHYQIRIALALRGESIGDFEWEQEFAESQARAYEIADSEEWSYDTARIRFPYAFGGAFVTRAWLQHGRAGIAALFEEPPLSTHEVLFGARDERTMVERALNNAALPFFSFRYQPVSFSALGAWMVRGFLVRSGLDPEAALAAAESVGADVFSVQVLPANDTLVSVWRMSQFEGASADFIAQLELGELTASSEDGVLTFIAGPPEIREDLQSFRWLPLPAGTQPALPARAFGPR